MIGKLNGKNQLVRQSVLISQAGRVIDQCSNMNYAYPNMDYGQYIGLSFVKCFIFNEMSLICLYYELLCRNLRKSWEILLSFPHPFYIFEYFCFSTPCLHTCMSHTFTPTSFHHRHSSLIKLSIKYLTIWWIECTPTLTIPFSAFHSDINKSRLYRCVSECRQTARGPEKGMNRERKT